MARFNSSQDRLDVLSFLVGTFEQPLLKPLGSIGHASRQGLLHRAE